MNKSFEVSDRVFWKRKFRDHFGKVIAVNGKPTAADPYPVIVKLDGGWYSMDPSFTLDGRFQSDGEVVLFHAEPQHKESGR